jgi:hypothetical protein
MQIIVLSFIGVVILLLILAFNKGITGILKILWDIGGVPLVIIVVAAPSCVYIWNTVKRVRNQK